MSNINATNSINNTTSTNANKEGKTMNNNTSIFSTIANGFQKVITCNGRLNYDTQCTNLLMCIAGGAIIGTALRNEKEFDSTTTSEEILVNNAVAYIGGVIAGKGLSNAWDESVKLRKILKEEEQKVAAEK